MDNSKETNTSQGHMLTMAMKSEKVKLPIMLLKDDTWHVIQIMNKACSMWDGVP